MTPVSLFLVASYIESIAIEEGSKETVRLAVFTPLIRWKADPTYFITVCLSVKYIAQATVYVLLCMPHWLQCPWLGWSQTIQLLILCCWGHGAKQFDPLLFINFLQVPTIIWLPFIIQLWSHRLNNVAVSSDSYMGHCLLNLLQLQQGLNTLKNTVKVLLSRNRVWAVKVFVYTQQQVHRSAGSTHSSKSNCLTSSSNKLIEQRDLHTVESMIKLFDPNIRESVVELFNFTR